jgi:hypothetical protein
LSPVENAIGLANKPPQIPSPIFRPTLRPGLPMDFTGGPDAAERLAIVHSFWTRCGRVFIGRVGSANPRESANGRSGSGGKGLKVIDERL